MYLFFFFFSSRRRHTRFDCDWSSDVCSSDLRPRSTTSCGSKTATGGCDMKVIVPLAGKGTRLLPRTKRVPKPLVRVAGRPVMDYVMGAGKDLDVEALIAIPRHLTESVDRYIVDPYDI